jgi:ribonuclease HII
MAILDKKHPQYGFGRNKGYPTKAHRQAIASFGPCSCHRLTFKGVREFVA